MKKLITITTLSTLLFINANAQEHNYIGLDIGNTTARSTVTSIGLGINESSDDDGGSQTLKVGHYFNDNHRAAVFYHNINADDAKFGMLCLGYDYLIGEDSLKPFAGVLLGYGRYDLDNYDFNIDGAMYGVQAGLNYEINSYFSLEAGYRFLKSTMNETYRESGYDADFKVDDFRNWFVGFNYNF